LQKQKTRAFPKIKSRKNLKSLAIPFRKWASIRREPWSSDGVVAVKQPITHLQIVNIQPSFRIRFYDALLMYLVWLLPIQQMAKTKDGQTIERLGETVNSHTPPWCYFVAR